MFSPGREIIGYDSGISLAPAQKSWKVAVGVTWKYLTSTTPSSGMVARNGRPIGLAVDSCFSSCFSIWPSPVRSHDLESPNFSLQI